MTVLDVPARDLCLTPPRARRRRAAAVSQPDPPAAVRAVVAAGVLVLGVERRDIYGRDRFAPYPTARHLVWLTCRDLTDLSFPLLGMAFGRAHTTIVSGIANVRNRICEGEGIRLAEFGAPVPLAELAARLRAESLERMETLRG